MYALLVAATRSSAQPTIDSLRHRAVMARTDSARVEALLHLANAFLSLDPDSAYACCSRAQVIAYGSGRTKDIVEVEGWLGYLAEQRGQLDDALAHYQKSLEGAERSQDRKNISTLLNNIAAIYKDQGKVDKALTTHRRGLVIRRAMQDTSGIATSLNNIGLIEYDQGRIPDAMSHYAEALHLYEAVSDQEGIATALHNIAGVYRDQGDHAEALAYFERALALRDRGQDPYGAATTEDNIGGVLEATGRTSDALAHYERALVQHEQAGDTRGMGYSLRNIASIEVKQGKADEAFRHATRASELLDRSSDKRGKASALWMTGLALERLGRAQDAERITREALTLAQELGYPQVIRDAAGSLDRIYRSAARWREALAMRDLHQLMRDSVLNQEARKSSLRQQYAYAYEKKEADLKAAQKEHDLLAHMDLQREKNRRNLFLLIGAGTLLLAMGLWSRLRFVRRSRAMIQHERDVADGLLLNILPAEVASELKTKGRTEAKHYDEVTVLFTDFKGFTAIAELLSPAELVAEIDTCFQAFDHIMERHGVEKIKTIGDAYMAVGGVPVARVDAPTCVVQAALDMQEFMDTRARARAREGKPAFQMRIGIHTGPVVAGIVGLKKFQYDVWGDTVNTASRMESSGEVGQVNISAATHALLKDDPSFRFEARGQVAAKGKGNMDMWFVMRSGV